jgi:hypothetical protein
MTPKILPPLALSSVALIAAASSCGGKEMQTGTGGAASSSTSSSTSHTVSVTITVSSSSTGGAGSTSGTGGSVGNPVISLSPLTNFDSETSVAAASNGFVAAAWIAVESSGLSNIGYAISMDGGATFGGPQMIMSPDGRISSDPVLTADAAGDFFLTWVGYRPGMNGMTTDMHIYVAEAAAGSTTFAAPVEASDPTDTASYDKPWILALPGGGLVVTYERDAPPDDFGLVAARSPDGATWQQAFVAESPMGDDFRNLAAKGGSRVWVTYVSDSTFGVSIELVHSDDGGATWSAETEVSLPSEQVAFEDPNCVAQGNDVWVSYGLTQGPQDMTTQNTDKLDAIRVAHTSDGVTIDYRVNAEDTKAGKLFLLPQMAIEDSGALDVTFYAGQMDQDPAGSFRRTRAPVPSMGFGPSTDLQSPVVFLGARGDPRWLGDYTGLTWSGGQLFMTYAVNASGSSEIAFGHPAVP